MALNQYVGTSDQLIYTRNLIRVQEPSQIRKGRYSNQLTRAGFRFEMCLSNLVNSNNEPRSYQETQESRVRTGKFRNLGILRGNSSFFSENQTLGPQWNLMLILFRETLDVIVEFNKT